MAHIPRESRCDVTTEFPTVDGTMSQERALWSCLPIFFRTASLCTVGRKGPCASCTQARKVHRRMRGSRKTNEILQRILQYPSLKGWTWTPQVKGAWDRASESQTLEKMPWPFCWCQTPSHATHPSLRAIWPFTQHCHPLNVSPFPHQLRLLLFCEAFPGLIWSRPSHVISSSGSYFTLLYAQIVLFYPSSQSQVKLGNPLNTKLSVNYEFIKGFPNFSVL